MQVAATSGHRSEPLVHLYHLHCDVDVVVVAVGADIVETKQLLFVGFGIAVVQPPRW